MKKTFPKKVEDEVFWHYRRKRIVVIGISLFLLILFYTFKNTSFLARTLSTISFLFLFYIIDHFFDVKFTEKHYLYIIFIALTGLMLSPLYYIYPNYDKILHFVLPMMLGSIIFHMVSKLKIKLRWKLLFVFLIVVGFVGVHEIGEYWLDQFFDFKLQGVFLRDIQTLEKYKILMDRIDDTMIDMTFGLFGSALYVLAVGIYEKLKN